MKISRKLGIAFALVLISFSILLIMASSLLLDKYYMQQKKSSIRSAYNEVVDYVSEDTDGITSDDIIGLGYIGQKTGTIIFFFDSNGDNMSMAPNTIFRNIRSLRVEANGEEVQLDTKEKLDEYLSTEGSYFEFKSNEQQNSNNVAVIGKYLDADGYVGGYILVYASYTSMKENTEIFNLFTIYVTLILFVVAMIASWVVSSMLTKPIKEAEAKTRKMANLDFSTKLEISSRDEIGQLSISINKMSDQLEKSINELKAANAQLEEDIKLKEKVNKLRQEFISDVSHELKTPIAIIGGYSEALKLEGLSQEDINEYADIIIDESKRMNKLVKDLLKFTQIESGFLKLEREEFEVLNIINDVINPNKLRLEEKKVELTVDCDDEIVVGDYDMMETVFNNFFVNAINHVDGAMKITVTGKVTDGKYRISVRNTGVQISEENQKRIWDSFYKVDKSRSRQYGGSGLGLSIVKSTMLAYNNKFGVFNNDDGVTFYFDLDLNNSVCSEEKDEQHD